MTKNEPEVEALLTDAREGRSDRLGDLLQTYRDRLLRMIDLRMDPRLNRRVGASDVIQEAYLEVATRLPEFFERREMPFFLWVRFLTGQKLLQLHRRHFGAEIRDIKREQRFGAGLGPGVSSVVFASALLDGSPTPSGHLAQQEERQRLEQAFEAMDPVDREVLALRHLEGLNNGETARVLGLSDSGASQRYYRAAERLTEILASSRDESRPA